MVTVDEKLYNKMPDDIKACFQEIPNPARDEVVEEFPDSKAGKYKGKGSKSGGIWQKSTGKPAGVEYGDEGSAARYTYKDKEYQVDGFVKRCKPQAPSNYNDQGSAARFFYCSKASKSERNKGLEENNHHPTIKPVALMQYLTRLITPKGGTCLDPYAGSGSTGMACKMEGFDFIGIELEEEYCEIARARIENTESKLL